jgi:ADP-ribose pyrophosphatase YjhB (NUDIX family)
MRISPKRPLSLEEFNYIYSKVPRTVIELICKGPDGVLLTKRAINPAKGMWHLPGGTILMGETIEQAAKRIALEELGVDIKIVKNLGILTYIDSKNTTGGYGIAIMLLVNLKSLDIDLDEQASEYKFFKENEIKGDQFECEVDGFFKEFKHDIF